MISRKLLPSLAAGLMLAAAPLAQPAAAKSSLDVQISSGSSSPRYHNLGRRFDHRFGHHGFRHHQFGRDGYRHDKSGSLRFRHHGFGHDPFRRRWYFQRPYRYYRHYYRSYPYGQYPYGRYYFYYRK